MTVCVPAWLAGIALVAAGGLPARSIYRKVNGYE